ncbi:hypothetical protein DC522_03270 [Microvirga sp. KLBC 81]|uniref:5-methylcytosine restriction system specificity protein McrC n=1 Tax=Microvirga sp. KLBC 81 TaxID=1862707 RepID=UPI000D508C23|nr:hypothetical protein [Microvirga sp. KLBC 81]PVE25807.1 hypothetical protein DC522_03270 [Microvirga sp. KLBC 81]
MTIPIRNLYYLFTYAWAQFPGGVSVAAGVDEAPDLPNLLAQLLISGANRLLRRGLDCGYHGFTEDTRAPRGRLQLDRIIKEQTLRRGSVICSYDELTADVLHNQIIKATARALARANNIMPEYAHELRILTRQMAAVSDIRVSPDQFRRVQLSRNTSQYLPLLKLCELVSRSLLPDRQGSETRFVDILEDEATMSAVFEEFLRNFYSFEQRAFRVAKKIMSWDANALTSNSAGFLPVMETDITLSSPARTIVIDAKFYREALIARHGSKKVRSGHLYQLFAYLEHAGLHGSAMQVDGALIYPAVGEPIDLRYQIRGHEVIVRAVDLSRPWREIHDELLEILSQFGMSGSPSQTQVAQATNRVASDKDVLGQIA